MAFSWWRAFLKKLAVKKSRPARRSGLRLRLEALEDRAVPAFLTPVSYATGTSAGVSIAGDFNNDGKLDLATANGGITPTVSVLLGNGDGTFATPVGYLAGPGAQDVKAADMNHDGKLDLVVADAVSAGSVSVLLGNGDGTFGPYRSYSAFSAPYRMTVADFNNDGNPDVAVANSYTSSMVTVLLGNADGSLGAYRSYNLGSQPWDVESGDFNGDGKADLAEVSGSLYQIEVGKGDGTFFAPDVTAAPAGTNQVPGIVVADFNGDGVADIAGATTSGSVTVSINSTLSSLASATGFQLTAPATTTAGAAVPLTVSAVDSAGNVVSNFLGTVYLTSSDPLLAGVTLAYTFTAADAGSHTFTSGVTLETVGKQTITASNPLLTSASQSVTVTPAAASRFTVSADAGGVAGAPLAFTVTAYDAYGNLATGYTGTVVFSSSDSQAALPAASTFTAADAGSHTFSAILKTAGPQTITVKDSVTPAVLGRSGVVTVTPAAATSFTLTGGGGYIGSPHTVTVTARDAYGNVATSYNGTVHITSSDATALLPADGALVAGIGTFQITPMTLGTMSITATDTTNPAITGTETGVLVTPGAAVRYTVSPVSSALAGTTQSFTVTAWDAFGDVSTVYGGTVLFSSSDSQAALPAAYTFTAADAGSHTFNVTLRTAGSQSLTVRDAVNLSLSSTQTGIVITPGVTASLSVTPLHATTAGVAQSFTVTARDAFGNVATGYRGTVSFGSSDTQAVLPAAYTFTAADAGSHTFSMTFKSSGGQTFTVQDTANAANLAFTFSQRDIQVSPAAVVGFAFRAPSNVVAGTPFTMVVSAVDAFGNVVPTYTGKVHFTGPSGGGNLLPADYTFTAADAGSHTFTVTLTSTGTQTIGVQDVLNGSLKGQVQVKVNTSGTVSGGGTASGGGGGGGSGGGGKTTGA